MDYLTAVRLFPYFETRICMIGHTHVPAIWKESAEKPPTGPAIDYHQTQILSKTMLNPGSVGQPRDHNPKASYAIFDSDKSTWELRRTAYDYKAVQNRIKESGLPWRHALRLAEGW